MKTIDPLYYTATRSGQLIFPKVGESIDQLHKRLARLARSYRTSERVYSATRRGDHVVWLRVYPGQQSKLAPWYRLNVGEDYDLLPEGANEADLKKARRTAAYLKRSGRGEFAVVLEGDRLSISRKTAGDAARMPFQHTNPSRF